MTSNVNPLGLKLFALYFAAIFWLAQKGSRKAAEQITDAIENDPETEVKKKAVFALSQMHDAANLAWFSKFKYPVSEIGQRNRGGSGKAKARD